MREFFRGWRRKAGVVTLAMALMLTVAWLRSYVVSDWITLWFKEAGQSALSNWGCIVWQNCQYPDGTRIPKGFDVDWESTDAAPYAPSMETHLREWLIMDPSDVAWGWSWCGFFVGTASDVNVTHRTWIFSYSSLVLPLTLLSAWFLLTKPRPAKSAKESNRA